MVNGQHLSLGKDNVLVVSHSLSYIVCDLNPAINAGQRLPAGLCFDVRHNSCLGRFLKGDAFEVEVRILRPLGSNECDGLIDLFRADRGKRVCRNLLSDPDGKRCGNDISCHLRRNENFQRSGENEVCLG